MHILLQSQVSQEKPLFICLSFHIVQTNKENTQKIIIQNYIFFKIIKNKN